MTFQTEALDEIYRLTEGYPFFLQAYGSFLWRTVEGGPVTPEHVHAVVDLVNDWLDANFFSARISVAGALERRCLLALARSDPGPAYDRTCLEELDGVTAERVDDIVESLCELGLLFVLPDDLCAFSVPQFGEHVLRHAGD